jgi:hypothetical protein
MQQAGYDYCIIRSLIARCSRSQYKTAINVKLRPSDAEIEQKKRQFPAFTLPNGAGIAGRL